jgi:CBS domain-containing protein
MAQRDTDRTCPEARPIKLAAIMTRPPITVCHDTTLDEAAARMIGQRVGCLLVVGPEGQLVGIVTPWDFGPKEDTCPFPLFCASGFPRRQAWELTHSAASHHPRVPTRTAREIMTPMPIVLTEDDTVMEAVAKMLHLGFDHLPVVRQGVPVGIVSRDDLLRLTLRLLSGWSRDGEREVADSGAGTRAVACGEGDTSGGSARRRDLGCRARSAGVIRENRGGQTRK